MDVEVLLIVVSNILDEVVECIAGQKRAASGERCSCFGLCDELVIVTAKRLRTDSISFFHAYSMRGVGTRTRLVESGKGPKGGNLLV